MNIIFVVYEWCFAVLSLLLHRKMKNRGSFLLYIGLVLMAILTTVEYAAEKFFLKDILFSKILLALIVVAPVLTLIGFLMIVINLEKYTGKK